MTKSKQLDVVFLLDRSGSMQGSELDTIGGYNSYLESQKGNNAKITTVLFDDRQEVLHDRVDLKKIRPMTEDEYYVRGSTALLDAVGTSVKKMENIQNHLPYQ